MSDVKWIKITTDIFDDEKILLIESLPEADSLIVIWFKLLCLAGKMNNSGVFMLNDKIAYTEKMLATIFRRKETTVKLALETFEQFGMVEVVDDVITIPNWGKHQSLDQLENKREYQREYMREYREKQKKLTSKTNSKANSKANVSFLEREGDKEKDTEEEREGEGDKIRESTSYQLIADMYNDTCVSFPRLTTLSDARKKAIKARLKTYSVEDFQRLFDKAEGSTFLKGGNDRNWSATFDWLIKDTNMAKVLDGNYDNKTKTNTSPAPPRKNDAAQELDDYYKMIADWVDGKESESK